MPYSEILFIISIILASVAAIMFCVVKWQVARYAINYKHLNGHQKKLVKAAGALLFIAVAIFLTTLLTINSL